MGTRAHQRCGTRKARYRSLGISLAIPGLQDGLSGVSCRNAGQLQAGFPNPFHQGLYYGPSSNDIKHRYLLGYNYEIPAPANWSGLAKTILGGWAFSGVYNVQSGGTFSVFDNLVNDNVCARTAGIFRVAGGMRVHRLVTKLPGTRRLRHTL